MRSGPLERRRVRRRAERVRSRATPPEDRQRSPAHDDLADRVQQAVDLGPARAMLPDRPVRPSEDHPPVRGHKPLVPLALQTPGHTASVGLRRAGFVAVFHLVRLPVYLVNNLVWAPRGLARICRGMVRWVQVQDMREVEWSAAWHAITTSEYQWFVAVHEDRRRQSRSRLWSLVLAVPAALAGVVAGLLVPATVVPTVLAVVLVLGWAGRPMDRPYIESAVVTSERARRITPDMILQALHAAGLCKGLEGDDAPEFVAPGVYRDGPGYGAVVDLPPGKTAQQAIEVRDKIAAALRVSQFRLFIEQEHGARGHAGQVKLWIADDDPHARTPAPSPLVNAPSFDLWEQVPFGVNARGDRVGFPLVWTSVLIGALPRMGKTNALRLLLSAAVLDPHARILAWDGKGGKDLAALQQVAHAFGAGQDDRVAGGLVDALTALEQEMQRRYQVLNRLPDDECPEGKITPALSHDQRRGMPLTVVAIDEFQVFLENKKHGARVLELLTNLAKVGPAAGIILILSTQRPSSTVMKTDFRDVIGTRIAFRVTTREFSEMILGSGTYRAGLDASKFLASHKGVGILLGADDGPLADRGGQVLQTHLMDLPVFTRMCERGRELREGAGTLSGVAAGEEDEVLSDRILEHVAAVFQAGETKAHSETLVARLAGKYPGLYQEFDAADLAAALGRHGIPTSTQVWAPRLKDQKPANQRGFHRKDIIDRIAERADPVPDTPPEDL